MHPNTQQRAIQKAVILQKDLLALTIPISNTFKYYTVCYFKICLMKVNFCKKIVSYVTFNSLDFYIHEYS